MSTEEYVGEFLERNYLEARLRRAEDQRRRIDDARIVEARRRAARLRFLDEVFGPPVVVKRVNWQEEGF